MQKQKKVSMEKRKITITLDIHEPEQAMVYEYLNRQERKKSKLIVELVSEKIKKEDSFAYHERAVIEALLKNSFFMSTLLEKLKETENKAEKREVDKSQKTDTEKKQKVEEKTKPDISLIKKGLAMFEEI